MVVFALTGEREKFLQAGFDGYQSKPIEIAELQAEILRVVGFSKRN